MIEIGKVLVSDDLLEKNFVCNLSACKGVCCVAGDAGAPLEADETGRLEDVYEEVKPYLTPEGIEAIEKNGHYYLDTEDNKMATTLVEGQKCAYVYEENGITLCGIEKAWRDGKISWMKPISCHLYPVRITEGETYTLVNYEKWEICKPACSHGDALKVPVYKFLKEPLIRKFGEDFFEALDAVYHREGGPASKK